MPNNPAPASVPTTIALHDYLVGNEVLFLAREFQRLSAAPADETPEVREWDDDGEDVAAFSPIADYPREEGETPVDISTNGKLAALVGDELVARGLDRADVAKPSYPHTFAASTDRALHFLSPERDALYGRIVRFFDGEEETAADRLDDTPHALAEFRALVRAVQPVDRNRVEYLLQTRIREIARFEAQEPDSGFAFGVAFFLRAAGGVLAFEDLTHDEGRSLSDLDHDQDLTRGGEKNGPNAPAFY